MCFPAWWRKRPRAILLDITLFNWRLVNFYFLYILLLWIFFISCSCKQIWKSASNKFLTCWGKNSCIIFSCLCITFTDSFLISSILCIVFLSGCYRLICLFHSSEIFKFVHNPVFIHTKLKLIAKYYSVLSYVHVNYYTNSTLHSINLTILLILFSFILLTYAWPN